MRIGLGCENLLDQPKFWVDWIGDSSHPNKIHNPTHPDLTLLFLGWVRLSGYSFSFLKNYLLSSQGEGHLSDLYGIFVYMVTLN